jgi:fumarate hydratase subunit alpha
MRKIDTLTIINAVKNALIKINYELDDSLVTRIKKAKAKEKSALSISILDDILENQAIAREGSVPLCQDTGIAVVFVEIGRDVYLDDDLEKIINTGVKEAYDEGFLRKSVVAHPFDRVNTKDNTPAIVHVKQVAGDKLTLKIASKGAGSENMSRVVMLTPSEGIEGVKKLVINTVTDAGGKPCPPIIVGIGLGGNFEKSAILAKEALLRNLDDQSDDPIIRQLEKDLLDDINETGVGPMGVGGETTCLAVKINYYPMHIASLPVAINIQCHSARHIEVVL